MSLQQRTDEVERNLHMAAKKTKKKTKKPDALAVKLTKEELLEVTAALDSHMYWELSEQEYRNNGFVNDPGSDDDEDAQRIEVCRRLQNLLSNLAATLEG